MAKYLRGLVTGYGSLGVVVLFTAVTVPLGISQMGLEGWGVWIFCQQASAAICLFESFTQSAFVRLLIQVKDDTGSEIYKKMVSMGRWSFWAQGLLLVLLHLAFASILPWLFPNVSGPSAWMTTFVLGAAALVNQAGKINGQLLYAHQHQDQASLAATAGLLLNLCSTVLLLPRFPGPETMAWSFLAGSAFSQGVYFYLARRSECLPKFPGKPAIRWSDFLPLWQWGRRFFLYSLLNNLSTSLPTLLAGRFLALEMVGVWGVLQRIANLVSQGVLKIPQLAVPALMEMHARGEESQFRKRSQQILWTQNALAGLALGGFATGGDMFLKFWLGESLPMDSWVLPVFTFALLADFDQRFRFDLETIRFQIRRPTIAAFLKIFLILSLVPFFSHLYGFLGMILALAAVYGLFLLPLSLSSAILPAGYSISVRPTLVGAIAFAAAAAAVGLGRLFWP
jgi:O-antigen/teichoic acid export membrane protein